MARHPGHRINWFLIADAAEESTDHHIFGTKGWLELETSALISSLARALRVEGLCSRWDECESMAQSAQFTWEHDDESGVALPGEPITIATVPVAAG